MKGRVALMIEQMLFTVIAFVLFLCVFLLKMIKKNDTTYLVILGIQAIGILLNLIKINYEILNGTLATIALYLLCIIIPSLVFILEAKKINVSEILRVASAEIHIWMRKNKKAKKILIELVDKYEDSYIGHKMLANIYEKEGGMRKAIEEYVKVLEIKKNDHNAFYRISILLNSLGKKEEAIEMLRTLLKNRPHIYEASRMLRRDIFRKKRVQKCNRSIHQCS